MTALRASAAEYSHTCIHPHADTIIDEYNKFMNPNLSGASSAVDASTMFSGLRSRCAMPLVLYTIECIQNLNEATPCVYIHTHTLSGASSALDASTMF